jgi:hypothetical protein
MCGFAEEKIWLLAIKYVILHELTTAIDILNDGKESFND